MLGQRQGQEKPLTEKGKCTNCRKLCLDIESEDNMSMNQKYTWHDFLKENPEHREKKTKRTSSEGKKAFESAYKAHLKKYLAEQSEKYDKQAAKAAERSKALSAKVSALRKAKKFAKATHVQKKTGQADRAAAQLAKQKQRAQAARKSI